MTTCFRRHAWPLLLALAAATACGDDGTGPDPDEVPADQLNILRLDGTAPPLVSSEATFWARTDEDREVRLFFQDEVGGEGEEYLRLKIPAGALLRRPDGTGFAAVDSVEVTVRVVDPARILFELEPAGLQFDPDRPAELRLDYAEADDDLNDDGVVDVEDEELELELAIWRQASPGAPFVRLFTLQAEELDELEADLPGFSRFAIAY